MREPSPRDRLERAVAAFRRRPRVVLLACGVQHYAWGDPAFLPALLARQNPEGRPWAELWMGAHPDLPSRAILGNTEVPLDLLIERAAEPLLGPGVAESFGRRLPFLFKVLAAAVPLSIQAHPSREQAREGFARENAAGVPLGAAHRNYKDANHKPELIVALTELYGLCGFRPLPEIFGALAEVPELARLGAGLDPTPASLAELYGRFMQAPRDEVDAVLDPLVRRLAGEAERRSFSRDDRAFWVLRADRLFSRPGHRDRGLLSIYLLNLVHLRPGRALFLRAGVPHAYLEGAGVEIMANSNNVLRGGLTPKHVDVPELLRTLRFEGGSPEIVEPVRDGGGAEWVYRTPAAEFELQRVELGPGEPYHRPAEHAVEIGLVVDAAGGIDLTAAGTALSLTRGRSFLAPRGVPYALVAAEAATLYRATLPG